MKNPIHGLILTCLWLLPAASAEPLAGSAKWSSRLHAMQDIATDTQTRHDAEDTLKSAPPAFLRTLFFSLDAPVEGLPAETLIALHPGLPNREWELQHFPSAPQVVYARLRLWDHLTKHAEPAAERARIIADLFPEASSDFQRRLLLQAARSSWSPETEQAVGAWLLDRALPCDIREFSARSLGIFAYSEWYEGILEEAWALRGDPCAARIASPLAITSPGVNNRFDPRVAVLLADNFEAALREGDPRAATSRAVALGDYLRVTLTPPLDSPLDPRGEDWQWTIISLTSDWLIQHKPELEADAARAANGNRIARRHTDPKWIHSREEDAIRTRKHNQRLLRERPSPQPEP